MDASLDSARGPDFLETLHLVEGLTSLELLVELLLLLFCVKLKVLLVIEDAVVDRSVPALLSILFSLSLPLLLLQNSDFQILLKDSNLIGQLLLKLAVFLLDFHPSHLLKLLFVIVLIDVTAGVFFLHLDNDSLLSCALTQSQVSLGTVLVHQGLSAV